MANTFPTPPSRVAPSSSPTPRTTKTSSATVPTSAPSTPPANRDLLDLQINRALHQKSELSAEGAKYNSQGNAPAPKARNIIATGKRPAPKARNIIARGKREAQRNASPLVTKKYFEQSTESAKYEPQLFRSFRASR